jgi:hypothetical protein
MVSYCLQVMLPLVRAHQNLVQGFGVVAHCSYSISAGLNVETSGSANDLEQQARPL